MAHNFETTTTTGNFASSTANSLTGQGAVEKLRMEPSANFLYMHHPNRWQIMNGKVLPSLTKLQQVPGLNNVSPRAGGDMSSAIGMKIQNGWQIIPHDVIAGGYVKKYEGYRGAVHLSIWETPRQVGRRVYDPETNTEGYQAFLQGLVDGGVIQPASQYVLRDLVERAQQAVERSAPFTATEAGRAIHQRMVEKLEAIEIACGIRKPRPAPKKRAPRKKTAAKKATIPEATDG